MINKNAYGTYHIAGKDILSRYKAARIIAKVFSLDSNLIKPVPSDFFSDIAPRPKNTSYSTKKIESELGVQPLGFEEGLMILKNKIPSLKEELN